MSRELIELRQQYTELQEAYSEKCVEMLRQVRIAQDHLSYALKMKRSLGNVRVMLGDSKFKGRAEVEQTINAALGVSPDGV